MRLLWPFRKQKSTLEALQERLKTGGFHTEIRSSEKILIWHGADDDKQEIGYIDLRGNPCFCYIGDQGKSPPLAEVVLEIVRAMKQQGFPIGSSSLPFFQYPYLKDEGEVPAG